MMVPENPMTPGGAHRPVYGLCATRYQEGPASASEPPKCKCNMFAIASCSDCGKPLCGDHSTRASDGMVLCLPCRYTRVQAEQLQAATALNTAWAKTPFVTMDMLESVITGKPVPPLVKEGGPELIITGTDALKLFRHAPTTQLWTMDSEHVKTGMFKKEWRRVTDTGWLLDGDHKAPPRYFLLSDGRLRIDTSFQEHGSTWTFKTQYVSAGRPLPGGPLMMALSFKHFPEQFKRLKYLPG
jgi:hypothetical protein